MGFWKDVKQSIGWGFQDGANVVSTAKSDLGYAITDKLSNIGGGNAIENVGKAAGVASEGAATVLKPAWKAGTWLTKKSAIVGLLAGVGIWAYGKNEEKNREAKNTLRQANLDEMEAQTAALSAKADQAQLGANTLCGLQPVEGEQVAKLGRSSGGKNNVLDFVQPTPDVARGAVPA